MKRFELSINTKWSGNSIVEIKDLLKKVDKLKIKGIAITDFNDINSFFEIKKYIKEYPELKIIYGTKIKTLYNNLKIKVDILVKNQEGLNNLYKILSIINTTENNLDLHKLFEFRKGLLIGLNLTNKEIYKLLSPLVMNDIYEFIKVFDYLIVIPFKDQNYIKKIVEMSNKYNKLLVASNDVRYLNKEDKKYYELYKQKKLLEDNYLMSLDEIYQGFNYLFDEDKDKIIINNPNKIALLIDKIELLSNNNFYQKDKISILKNMVYEKANDIYNNKIPEYINQRIKEELSLVNSKTAYSLLINKKLIEISNELGYETSTRGGVVSFYINYLLGITKINPIDYNLDYGDFIKDINKNVVIGINFDSKVKQKLEEYLKKEFNVICCGTIGKTYDEFLLKTYDKRLTKEEKNRLLGIKRKNGKLPCNYFVLPKTIDSTQVSPIIELNELATMIDYHYIQDNLIRLFIAEENQVSLYNDLNKKLKYQIIIFNDSNVWKSINKESLKEDLNIIIKNKVSNINELAKEWCESKKTNDWNPPLSYGIEYSILYYKIAYMRYYNREKFYKIIEKHSY